MLSESKRITLEEFSAGRRFYKLMEFEKARSCFVKALEADPDDGPSKVYLERCTWYIQNPPPEDWDGVFTMTSK